MSEMIETQNEILGLLKQKEEDLIKIRESEDPLIEKWQRFLGVILPIQIMVIRKHGYVGNQKGLAEYNQRLIAEADREPVLKKLNNNKWAYLFEKTFGLSEVRVISLEDAQKMTREIASVMTTHAFLKKIDHAVGSSQERSMFERRQRLLDVLLPAQMEVMKEYGFVGEEGYIQAQRAMMDYFFDPEIIADAQRAQDIIFKRAQLIG